MGRLLELILFAFFLWLAYEGLKARVRAFFSSGPPPARRRPAPPAAQPPETLVRCAACGTHVLRSRALMVEGGSEVYCSERCRNAANRKARA
jgi:uncharacterized protein